MNNTVILRLLKESNGCGLSDLGRFNIEAFTELIVKECAKVAREHHFYGDIETPADAQIKKHFGVE